MLVPSYRYLLVTQFVLGFLFVLVCSLGLHLACASMCVGLFCILWKFASSLGSPFGT